MPHYPGTTRQPNGFTMTELLTTVVIMAVACAVAIPQFSGNTEQFAQAAARTISQDIQFAQEHAVTNQSPVTLSISSSGDGYVLKDSDGITLTNPVSRKPYSVSFQDDAELSKLTISHSFEGNADIVFDSYGSPNTSGAFTISHSSMDSNVVVTLHEATGSVTVTTP